MSAPRTFPFYVANRPEAPNSDLEVTDKHDGSVAFRTALAGPGDVERALAAAESARAAMRRLPAYEREAVLRHCTERFEARADELAAVLCTEAGKPVRDARGEVARLVDTFRIAAAESLRIGGEVIPLEVSPRAHGYSGRFKRVPAGVCSFITPFNFPLNLVAHKVAPAIAAGCPFVLKPASLTPVGALMIAEILAETDLPPGAFSVLPAGRDAADALVTDARPALLSFTGSAAVGWDMKARAGKKKVVLELGGNAAVIVDRDTDLEDAVERIVVGAFYQSGQSCISVQRILVHETVYEGFRDRLAEAVRAVVCGDPKDEETVVGPMISEAEASRVEKWVRSAVAAGASLVCGGTRTGTMIAPTLLENVPAGEPVAAEEVFGPVAILDRFASFDDAIAKANAGRYGLQAGVFTRDVYNAEKAWNELEVGGVIIGDVPSWRVDHMPYGGVKDSGLGREGLRFAIEDMTEIRMLVLRTP